MYFGASDTSQMQVRSQIGQLALSVSREGCGARLDEVQVGTGLAEEQASSWEQAALTSARAPVLHLLFREGRCPSYLQEGHGPSTSFHL